MSHEVSGESVPILPPKFNLMFVVGTKAKDESEAAADKEILSGHGEAIKS